MTKRTERQLVGQYITSLLPGERKRAAEIAREIKADRRAVGAYLRDEPRMRYIPGFYGMWERII